MEKILWKFNFQFFGIQTKKFLLGVITRFINCCLKMNNLKNCHNNLAFTENPRPKQRSWETVTVPPNPLYKSNQMGKKADSAQEGGRSRPMPQGQLATQACTEIYTKQHVFRVNGSRVFSMEIFMHLTTNFLSLRDIWLAFWVERRDFNCSQSIFGPFFH